MQIDVDLEMAKTRRECFERAVVETMSGQLGEAWVDPQILAVAGLHVGDLLKVGEARLRIARVITFEPDRGAQFVNLAPRVMIRAEDLPATGLVSPGSRISYSMLAAGSVQKVQVLRDWLQAALKPGQKLVTIENGRPEIRRSLDRAQQFLSLVAMLAVLIAAVAVAPLVKMVNCAGAWVVMNWTAPKFRNGSPP